MKLFQSKPIFFKKISQTGILLLFILLSQNTVFAMAVNNMSGKGNPIIELPKIEVPAERFQSRNYSVVNKTLSVEDEAYLNKAILATITILLANDTLESEHAYLGQYDPFVPKVGPMKRINFRTGDMLGITLFRKNENFPWRRADIGFIGRNIILNTQFQHLLTGLPIDFVGITEEKIPDVMVEVEGEKVQSYKPYYAYRYHLKDQPKIEIIFDVKPDDLNKKSTFPLVFRRIHIIHHD